MHIMARDEWLAFVQHGTRTGKLATMRADGAPHVAPVWFVVDEGADADYLVLTTAATTAKGRALLRDPRFALCVDSEEPPYAFVSVQAEAELSEDLDEMRSWASRIGSRYMGEDRALEFGRRNAVPGELLVRGRITKVVAQAGVAD
ncbi:PPOX class F420-dependent oxidoreductase [Actinophytocola sediminis]